MWPNELLPKQPPFKQHTHAMPRRTVAETTFCDMRQIGTYEFFEKKCFFSPLEQPYHGISNLDFWLSFSAQVML